MSSWRVDLKIKRACYSQYFIKTYFWKFWEKCSLHFSVQLFFCDVKTIKGIIVLNLEGAKNSAFLYHVTQIRTLLVLDLDIIVIDIIQWLRAINHMN